MNNKGILNRIYIIKYNIKVKKETQYLFNNKNVYTLLLETLATKNIVFKSDQSVVKVIFCKVIDYIQHCSPNYSRRQLPKHITEGTEALIKSVAGTGRCFTPFSNNAYYTHY